MQARSSGFSCAIISHQIASIRKVGNRSNADGFASEKQIVKGFRTPSWFRAKRNIELKQMKAKISQRNARKRKKRQGK